jgi:hypothetical protein
MNHPPDAMEHAGTASGDEETFLHRASRLRELVRELACVAPATEKSRLAALERAVAGLGAGHDEAGRAGESADLIETLRAHPVQVTAAAVGAGVLTWWLLGWRP